MSFCPHHVYNARYCQVCTPNSGGGLVSPSSPPTEYVSGPPEPEFKDPEPLCPKCKSRQYKYYTQLNEIYCLQCGYNEEC